MAWSRCGRRSTTAHSRPHRTTRTSTWRSSGDSLRWWDRWGKLHTARSRNDQVVTDLALFVRAHALDTRTAVRDLMQVLVDLAERRLDWTMPGYTHLRRARPVCLSHRLLAYFWKLRRDLARSTSSCGAVGLPLGAGTLAGVDFNGPSRGGARAGVRRRRAQLDRRRVQSRLRARLPGRRRDLRDPPPVPARRRGRALVERSVRVLRGARRVHQRLEHHAPEEEPGRR